MPSKKKGPKMNEYEKRDHRDLIAAELSSPPGKSPSSTFAAVFDPELKPDSAELKFAKNLGNTNVKIRHRTVNKLQTYLSARASLTGAGFSELDFMKLWKGMWYCLWLADKGPVQDELSKRLSCLLNCLKSSKEEDLETGDEYAKYLDSEWEGDIDASDFDFDDYGEEGSDSDSTLPLDEDEVNDEFEKVDYVEESELQSTLNKIVSEEGEDDMLIPHNRGAHLICSFLRCFFRTMRREWGGLDQYRIDKFYTLIRYVIREVYNYLAERDYHVGLVRLLNDMIMDEILSQVPNGLRTHLIDIVLKEFSGSCADKNVAVDTDTFLNVFENYFGIAMSETDESVRSRVYENFLLKFLTEYSNCSDNIMSNKGEDGPESSALSNVDVNQVAQHLFDLAADESCTDSNRKKLYDMNKTYVKRINKIAQKEKKKQVQKVGGGFATKESSIENKKSTSGGGNVGVGGETKEDTHDEAKGTESKKKSTKNGKGAKEKKKTKGEKEIAKENLRKRKSSDDFDSMEDVDRSVGGKNENTSSETLTSSGKKRKKNTPKKNEKAKSAADSSTVEELSLSSPPASNHVSFGKNRARSYKDSMKGIKNLTPEVMSPPPPKRGILRKKEKDDNEKEDKKKEGGEKKKNLRKEKQKKAEPGTASPKNRKKAKDYF